ncbi:MAG: SH3 domain-containing protein [Oscillospiraceae bacterium]|nr:SH3 domain-containing protein [Oscillospiraceae bacterium]
MNRRIALFPAAVCLLLSGCGTEKPVPAANGSSAEPVALTDETTDFTAETTAALSAADSVSDAVVSGIEMQTTAASQAGAPESSTSEPENTVPSFDLEQIYDENFAALRCTGRVIARDGLNFRTAPDAGSAKLHTLEPETEVEVLGFVRSGDVYDYNNRWLKISFNGQEGFALAEYIAVECTTPASGLSEQERGTLGLILYYQSMHLYPDYHRHGGPLGTYTDQFREGYCRVQSNASEPLTYDHLIKEFHRYFSRNMDNYLDECYLEDGGNLYVMVGYGDNVSLDYVLPDIMTGQSDTALDYHITVHHYPEFADADFTEWANDDFRIVYEDGSWKTAVMKEEY